MPDQVREGCRLPCWTYRIKGGLCWVLNGYALKEYGYDGYISGAPYDGRRRVGRRMGPFHGFTPKPINFGPYENHKLSAARTTI